MRCVICNSYFKKDQFNSGVFCAECLDAEEHAPLLDPDAEIEVQHLVSPNGKTQPKFYD